MRSAVRRPYPTRAVAKAVRRRNVANRVWSVMLAAACMSVPLWWAWLALE